MRYGIKSVTMDDIAREMGISKKTLYQYVENKSDLIGQIFQEKIKNEKQCMADIREAATDAVDEILRIARYVIQELRQMSPTVMYDLRKYYRDTWRQMEALHQRHIYQLIRENLERGQAEGLYRENIDVDIIAKLYVAKTPLVVDEDIFPTREYNVEKLFEEYMMYHIHGIASAEGLALLALHPAIS